MITIRELLRARTRERAKDDAPENPHADAGKAFWVAVREADRVKRQKEEDHEKNGSE